MSEALSFRPMTEADLDAVLKIEYAAFSHPWTRGIFLDGLGKYQIWLMFEGEQQVGHGVVQIILDEAHLLNITVKPENQGRGLGLALLEHLMSRAYAANARECFLEVRDSNTGAFRLYERYGFNEIGRRRDYYPAVGGREDAVVMACTLGRLNTQNRCGRGQARPSLTSWMHVVSALAVYRVQISQLRFIQAIAAANIVFIHNAQVVVRRRCLHLPPGHPARHLHGSGFPGSYRHRSTHDHRSKRPSARLHAPVRRASDARARVAAFHRRFPPSALLVKIQLAHRAHAVFVVINRFGLCSAVGTS